MTCEISTHTAWEWNNHAVKEAGTVAGKQSLKLNVYPDWNNYSGLCVQMQDFAFFPFNTYTKVHIIHLWCGQYIYLFFSVSLSRCLDNWPQRSVHVHAMLITPAFNLWGGAFIAQVPKVTWLFVAHLPSDFIHKGSFALFWYFYVDFTAVCLPQGMNQSLTIISPNNNCVVGKEELSTNYNVSGLITHTADSSFQNKGQSRLELKSHLWQMSLRDQTCLVIQTQTCRPAA